MNLMNSFHQSNLVNLCLKFLAREIYPLTLKFSMLAVMSLLPFIAVGREITFPPVLSINQAPLQWGLNTPGIPGVTNAFAGLTTFANLPFVQCLKDVENDAIEPFDIAFLGAPFDTVSIWSGPKI